jgi:hypothetical protein
MWPPDFWKICGPQIQAIFSVLTVIKSKNNGENKEPQAPGVLHLKNISELMDCQI